MGFWSGWRSAGKGSAPVHDPIQLTQFSIARLEIKAGDIVVLKTEMVLSRMQEERARRQIEDFLQLKARGIKALILHSGLDLSVIEAKDHP